MKTSIEKVFTVNKPLSEVWDFLRDPNKVVTCVPGATITEQIDENNYKGQVSMKFGPVKAKYDGKITIDSMDQENKEMIILGRGTDSRGKGGADMKMYGKLVEQEDGSTEVEYKMDVSVTGMLAQFGSRLIGDVSNQVANQFINTFKAKLEGGESTEAEVQDQSVNAASLMGSVVKDKLGGIFGKKKEES